MRGRLTARDVEAYRAASDTDDEADEEVDDEAFVDYSLDRKFEGSVRLVRGLTSNPSFDMSDTLFGVLDSAIPGLTRSDPSLTDDDRSSLAGDLTIADVVVPFQAGEDGDEPPEDALTTSFELALEVVREIQRAYHIVRHEPITLVTRERLPLAVPYVVAPPTSTDMNEISRGLFVLHHNLYATVRDPDLAQDEQDRVDIALRDVEHGRPFTRFAEFRREAHVALRRDGDYNASVVWSATAAETLLDELLQHLMWEEKLRPEESLATFDTFLVTRVRTAFHGRLGGRWQIEGSGPVPAWYANIASTRNRIVHAGYSANINEASDAIARLDDLLGWLCDLLAQPRNLRRYPRTALKLAGEDGLARRGRMSKRLRALQADATEPNWSATFSRWKKAHGLLRQDLEGIAREPAFETSFLYAVRCPSGDVYWCLHDRLAELAAEVPDQTEALAPPMREGHAATMRRLNAEQPDEAISAGFPGETYRGRGPLQWVEQYRLVPMAGVMVDRSDLVRCSIPDPD